VFKDNYMLENIKKDNQQEIYLYYPPLLSFPAQPASLRQ